MTKKKPRAGRAHAGQNQRARAGGQISAPSNGNIVGARLFRAREDFLQKLKIGLQPKFDAEIAEFRALKIKETGNANAQIHLWDWRYYANQLKKEKYTVNEEELKVYLLIRVNKRGI